jgi:hypothetical protein
MANQSHTHSKNCPDYKAAAADRAKRDAATAERGRRMQAAARAHWMDTYDRMK